MADRDMEVDPNKRIRIFQELTGLVRRELPEKFPDTYERYSLGNYHTIEFDRDNHFQICAAIQGRLIINIRIDTLSEDTVVESYPEELGDLKPLQNYIIERMDKIFAEGK
jgi:hypothetical protein